MTLLVEGQNLLWSASIKRCWDLLDLQLGRDGSLGLMEYSGNRVGALSPF